MAAKKEKMEEKKEDKKASAKEERMKTLRGKKAK
jgi:hypothetical protein